MRDSPHNHSIMYYFTPLYILLFSQHSPVVYKDNFPLFYMYKSSIYYFVFDIDFLGLETSSTAAFKHLATIASDFLVLPLSPFIIIYIQIILAQDLHLLH